MDVLRKIKQFHMDVILGVAAFTAGYFLIDHPFKAAVAIVIIIAASAIGAVVAADNELVADEEKKDD